MPEYACLECGVVLVSATKPAHCPACDTNVGDVPGRLFVHKEDDPRYQRQSSRDGGSL